MEICKLSLLTFKDTVAIAVFILENVSVMVSLMYVELAVGFEMMSDCLSGLIMGDYCCRFLHIMSPSGSSTNSIRALKCLGSSNSL